MCAVCTPIGAFPLLYFFMDDRNHYILKKQEGFHHVLYSN